MKFGNSLMSISIPEWSKYYIRYKSLKDTIKKQEFELTHFLKTQEQLEHEFLLLIDEELERVNRFFATKKTDLETRLERLIEKSKLAITTPNQNHEAILLFLSGLEDYKSEFYRLLKYVDVNKTGFAKILKKFSKKIGSEAQESHLDEKINSAVFTNSSQLLVLIESIEDMEKMLNNVSRTLGPLVDIGYVSSGVLAILEDDNPEELHRLITESQLLNSERQSFLNAISRKSISLKAPKCFRKTLELGGSIDEFDDVNERSSVHNFAMRGQVEFLKILIDLKVDLEACDSFGRKAIHYASIHGHLSCVALLIDRGHVAVNPHDFEGYTPLFYSVIYGHDDIVKLLLTHSRNSSVGAVDELQHYLTNTFEDSDRQETLLALACLYGHISIAELLILAGADVNYLDENKESPLHHCCRHGYEACVGLLLSKGAQSELAAAITGWTPMFYCATNGFDECLRRLIQSGAEVNCTDTSGWTPFDYAVFRGHVSTATILKSYRKCPMDLPPLNGTSGDKSQTNSPLKGGFSPVLQRIYGHEYLKETSMVRIRLTSTDSRKPFEFARLHDLSMLRSHLSLILYDSDSHTTEHIINFPIKEQQDTLVFYRRTIADFSLTIDLVPTFKKSTILARALVLPTCFLPLSGIVTVPLMNLNLKLVGEINFEFKVIQPFFHARLGPEGRHTYWKAVKVIGHRGSGADNAARAGTYRRSHVNENTVLSFVTAASLGAEYVEFDVQLTKDDIPIIYHDWTIHDEKYEIPLNLIPCSSFKSLRKQIGKFSGESREEPAKLTRSSTLETSNALNVAIQTPYATLEETFKKVPASLSFNIEVKYPCDKREAESLNVPLAEVNHFVDKILEVVFNFAGDRDIIFSSFSPEICLAISFKQPNYPVFFLTEAGNTLSTDPRCNSLQGAIRFAKSANLFGIVSYANPLIDAPVIIRKIKESGLILLTYGESNNDVSKVQVQQKHGVDAVIVDHVAHIRKGLVAS